MKNSLDHLPAAKQDELAQVVQTLRASIDDLEMAILFGSYARGDYKEKKDLKEDRWSGHVSDYDILVVTGEQATAENTELSHQVADQCLALGLSATVRLILHDIQDVNIQLAEDQYFFGDIKKEGCWLYNSGRFTLAGPRELTPLEKQRIAQDHFDYWFENGQSFFKNYEFSFGQGDYRISAFHLHQAAEAAYKTILLVFTNYSPDEHYLSLLERRAAKHHAPLSEVFPKDTSHELHCFEQLDLAYIGARYQPRWRITKEELEHLGPCVRRLLDVTEEICLNKIQNHGLDGKRA